MDGDEDVKVEETGHFGIVGYDPVGLVWSLDGRPVCERAGLPSRFWLRMTSSAVA